jgi:hypothetical protein
MDEFFFVNSQNHLRQLTHELAIQGEKNPQLVLGIQQQATAQDIIVEVQFRSNGSFWQFQLMRLFGKIAFIKTSWNAIRIWISANK